ncbi:unnamed protein product [Musa hybrid cultivar]
MTNVPEQAAANSCNITAQQPFISPPPFHHVHTPPISPSSSTKPGKKIKRISTLQEAVQALSQPSLLPMAHLDQELCEGRKTNAKAKRKRSEVRKKEE